MNTINTLNPRKIYVENVRATLKVPTFLARLICEMAVTDKKFIKKIGIVCPNSDCNKIIATYNSLSEIPEEIICTNCEYDDDKQSVFNAKDLEKIIFYQINTANEKNTGQY